MLIKFRLISRIIAPVKSMKPRKHPTNVKHYGIYSLSSVWKATSNYTWLAFPYCCPPWGNSSQWESQCWRWSSPKFWWLLIVQGQMIKYGTFWKILPSLVWKMSNPNWSFFFQYLMKIHQTILMKLEWLKTFKIQNMFPHTMATLIGFL